MGANIVNMLCGIDDFNLPNLSTAERAEEIAKRCAAIDGYDVLDTPFEPEFDEIANLASAVCGTSFAAISFVCEDRQWFKAEVGLGVRQIPISVSFCAYAIRQADIFVVTDARQHPLFAANPLVTGGPKLRFYAGMPLQASDGTLIATLCVLDTVARPAGLTVTQQLTLHVLARQVEAQLELRRSIIERDNRAAEQRTAATALQWIATHDSLTHLGNRTMFHTQLALALNNAKNDKSCVAVILIDVDHFKQINDSLGHDAGDAVLCAFAARLRDVVREGDTVARLGGDEFGIVLTSVKARKHLATIVDSLNMRLREKLEYNGRLIECRASIGVAIYGEHAKTSEALIKCGDLALGVAKATRGCAVDFHPDMETNFEREIHMTALARSAIREDRLFPYYQPKVDLLTGELTGFEALLRWDQSTGRLGMPHMIAPAFLDTELSLIIGDRMMNLILDDMQKWVVEGVNFGQIALNTCAGDFAANDFAERLLAALKVRGLSPRRVEVEVTESVFLGRGSHYVLRALTTLAKRGVRIALDDFGTGFASLTHLKKFPVHVLKIDQTFVSGLGKSADDAAIVRALIGLGSSLGMETVAEGIETHEQAAFVRTCGCTLGQGFLYGVARPAPDIADLVKRMTRNANIVPFKSARLAALPITKVR
ncbi:putative bifunctional diguanylate cyclase/phosphodiesterase [Sphingorhabdus sp.]|uniref:putative bifunctional diguanylate cyclase/phosphodiesterase n=1 Tax=Sphingorhabdus sp. TaxID=1902408 RepID=UPI00391B8454